MIPRRNFLTSMGVLPFLPGLLSTSSAIETSRRSLILIWLDGGLSHLDSFDGKPEASPDIRGDLVSRESSLEGAFVSEHLPQLSQMMKDCVLVRSLTSPEGNHDRGSCYVLTGHRQTPVLTYPSFGSLFGHRLTPGQNHPVPAYVAIPDAHPFARQGYLPLTRGPFEVGGNPGAKDFSVTHLQPPRSLDRAMEMLEAVDALDAGARSESEEARDQFLRQAQFLSRDPEARQLFDLGQESAETRQAYGRHFLGQSCLLARRLVEGGVRTVFIRDRGWDHHRDIKDSLTFGYPPKFTALDQALSENDHPLARPCADVRV